MRNSPLLAPPPTPALGLQKFKFRVSKPAHWREWAAFGCILLCRVFTACFCVYCLLVLASLLTSPFGACATLTNRCECSCVVSMPNDEWNYFYHAGANTQDVQVRTVRPATSDDESLCGVCEPDWEECRQRAQDQMWPPPVGAHLNASYWLTCYRRECVAAVRQVYGEPLSKPNRPDPDEDKCTVAAAAPHCYVNLNPECQT